MNIVDLENIKITIDDLIQKNEENENINDFFTTCVLASQALTCFVLDSNIEHSNIESVYIFKKFNKPKLGIRLKNVDLLPIYNLPYVKRYNGYIILDDTKQYAKRLVNYNKNVYPHIRPRKDNPLQEDYFTETSN